MERAHRVPGMGACAAGVGTTTEGTATSLNLPTYLPSHTSGTAFIAAALTIGCHRGSVDYRHRRAQAVLDSCGGHLAIGIKCLIAAKPPISW